MLSTHPNLSVHIVQAEERHIRGRISLLKAKQPMKANINHIKSRVCDLILMEVPGISVVLANLRGNHATKKYIFLYLGL